MRCCRLILIALLVGVASHSGHDHDDHHHHHDYDHHHQHSSILGELSLVMKNAYGSGACGFRHCILEPFRHTTLVAVVGNEDADAHVEASKNTWKIMSDIELIDAELVNTNIESTRKSFLSKEKAKLREHLEAARRAEAAGGDERLALFHWTIERANPTTGAGDETV